MDTVVNEFAVTILSNRDVWFSLLVVIAVVAIISALTWTCSRNRILDRAAFSIVCVASAAIIAWIGIAIHATTSTGDDAVLVAESVEDTYGVALEVPTESDLAADLVVGAIVNDVEDKPAVEVTLEGGEVRRYLLSFDNETGEATLYDKVTLEKVAAQ